MKLGPKQTIMIMGAVLAGVVFFVIMFVYKPLWQQVGSKARKLQALKQKLDAAHRIFDNQECLEARGHLLKREEISLAIDEMTKAGKALNINFIMISPQEIIKPGDSRYPVLPIKMDLSSGYKELGLFFGALESGEKSIMTVRSFHIQPHPKRASEVKSQLITEIYMRGSEYGQE